MPTCRRRSSAAGARPARPPSASGSPPRSGVSTTRACLFPGALEAVEHAGGLGLPVIASDGDERYQRHKIEASGLAAAFEGRVLIFEHKERELETIRARYPARRYALIDDKPRILAAVKSALGDLVTTVLVEQGPYALEAVEGETPPDLRLPSIAAFGGLDAGALGAG